MARIMRTAAKLNVSGTRLIGHGWGRLFRRQRFLWLLWLLNLFLAWLAGRPLFVTIGGIADDALRSRELLDGFSIPAFFALVGRPEVSFAAETPLILLVSIVFFLIYLFCTGGILRDYLSARAPSRADFWAASGRNFWPLVRVALIFLLIGAVVLGLTGFLVFAFAAAIVRSASDAAGLTARIIAFAVFFLVGSAVRLWFDLTELEVVNTPGKCRVRDALRQSTHTFFRNLPRLYWIFLRIGLIGALLVFFFLLLWIKAVPSHSVFAAWALVQLMAIAGIATRLWQRGAEAAWYSAALPPLEAEHVAIIPPPDHDHLPGPPLAPMTPDQPPDVPPEVPPESIA